MRVAVVVNRFPTLSETFIVNKVAGLRAAGIDVTVVVHDRRKDAALHAATGDDGRSAVVLEALTAAGERTTALRAAAASAGAPAAAVALWRAAAARYGAGRRAASAWTRAFPLVAGRFDIVHFEYSGLAVQYLDALPLLAPAKLVASCRGAAEQIVPLVNARRAAELRQLFPAVDRVHCVSRDMLETVRAHGVAADRAFINRPAIAVDQFRRRTPYVPRINGPYRLLSTGRLHWKKGFEFALLAVRQLLDSGVDVNYEIIGGGIEEERLRYAIRGLGLEGRVELLGARQPEFVRERLEAADAFVLPSVSEGLSNAALEAMAMAVPLVSTTAGGMSEAIDDGCEGLLAPPWDAGAIAARLCQLLADPALRARLGEAARRRVEREFALERQIAVFVDEYRGLIDGRD